MASVDPWLFTTGPFNPKKIAPLNFRGSNFSLNLFKLKYEKIIENFERKFSFKDNFKLSVINLAVPSAVLRAIFPVKPSVTITLLSPSGILFPSMYPLNSKSF